MASSRSTMGLRTLPLQILPLVSSPFRRSLTHEEPFPADLRFALSFALWRLGRLSAPQHDNAFRLAKRGQADADRER